MDLSILQKIMSGDTDSLPSLGSQVVRIFTSSTFTDTMHERNLLMEEVYPRLRDYCRKKFGLDFQVVDMRWGVRDEATDDHMTSSLCMEEIRNCQRVSNGPNFVAFLGQRHGSRLFPPIIEADVFTSLRKYLIDKGSDVSSLDSWFRRDENSLPHVFVLQAISSRLPHFLSEDQETKIKARNEWNTIHKEIQTLLCEASEGCFEAGLINKMEKDKYFMSVTEEEIEHGIFQSTGDTDSQCLCFVRIIEDISDHISHNLAWRYIDKEGNDIDETAQSQLSHLRDERVTEKMKTEQLFRSNVKWSDAGGINPQEHSEYLHKLASTFYDSIVKLVDRASVVQADLMQNELVVEMLQHHKLADSRSKMFKGREDVLSEVKTALSHEERLTVINGVSGCGKTSILAKSSKMVHSWFQSKRHMVLIRFLGTTPSSTNIQTTLKSLCKQIASVYGNRELLVCPEEFNALVAHFQKCLSLATDERPLVIFLDSLDQLSSRNYAHKLTWLPQKLPNGCRIVVSTLTNMYGILDNLKRKTSTSNIIELQLLGEKLGLEVITSWLGENNRCLTTSQHDVVVNALSKCSLPIYVKLIFDQIQLWRSYEVKNASHLPTSVRDVINALFQNLERKHGQILVKHALAYVTASQSGLSETELEDILSIDDIVLTDVFQYHIPPVRRIPSILWIRIRHDVASYFVTREADGADVVYWYHRQFIEAAKARYINNQPDSFIRHIHSTLADFFQGRWHGTKKPFTYTGYQMKKLALESPEGEEDRKVASQPLYFELGKRKNYNLRKLNNLPFHMIYSGPENTKLVKTMCFFDYTWLHARLCSNGIHSVLADLDMLNDDHECQILRSALNLARSTLSLNPDTLALEITGRLIGLALYKEDNMSCLVDDCFINGCRDNGFLVKEQCYNAPGGALRYYLEHPDLPAQDLVMFLSESGTNLCAVTNSNSIVVWDLTNGEIEKEVKCIPEVPHKLNVVKVQNGKALLTGCYQSGCNPVVIFDTDRCDIDNIIMLDRVFSGVGFIEDYKVELVHDLILIILLGKSISFFQLKDGKELKNVEVVPTAYCVTEDKRTILIGDKADNRLCIIDVESSSTRQKFSTPGRIVYIVEHSNSNSISVSCDKVFAVSCYALNKKNNMYKENGTIQLQKFNKANKKQEIYLIKASPQGTYLMIYIPHAIILWSMVKNRLHRQFDLSEAIEDEINVPLTGIHFSSDERFIYAVHIERLFVWSITYNHLMRSIRVEASLKIDSFLPTVVRNPESGQSTDLICTSIRRATQIKVWEWGIQEEEPVPKLRLSQSCRYLSAPQKSNICIARSFLARQTSVIDLAHGRIRGMLSEDADVAKIHVTKSGQYAILGEINSSHPVRLWNTQTLQPLEPLPLNTLEFCSCVCSDSDRYIATHSETSTTENVDVRIWDIATSAEVTRLKFEEGGFEMMCFADNDRLLILHQVYGRRDEKGRDCLIVICDVESGDVIQQIGHVMTSTLHVTPDSNHIVYVRCGSAETDDRLVTMSVSKSNGNHILREYAVIPNGRRLIFSQDASKAIDLTVRGIDMKQGNIICDFKGKIFSNRAMYPHITPDGRFAVWLNLKEALVNVGRLDSEHPDVIATCYVHASPISLALYPPDLAIVGATDGRIMLLHIVDPADGNKASQRGSNLITNYKQLHRSYGITPDAEDDGDWRHQKKRFLSEPSKRSAMCNVV